MAKKKRKTKKTGTITRTQGKFNPAFVEIAERLKAGGCNNDDIAFILGVYDRHQIKKWIDKHADFKAAIEQGKELARQQLIAKGVEAACGYDYVEENEKWKPVGVDEVTGEPKMVLQEVSKFKRHRPPDGKLLLAFLSRLDPEFRKMYQRTVAGLHKSLTLKVSGKLESEKLQNLFGRLLEQQDTERPDRKFAISAEVGNTVSDRNCDSEGLSEGVS